MNGIQEVRGSIPLTSTSDIERFAGIDICGGSYAFALLEVREYQFLSWEIRILPSMSGALPLFLLSQTELALIDVPIGLLETPASRTCDVLLRKALGKRRSSVFYVPCRKVVYAQNPEVEHERLTGKRIQRQALGLLRAIKEVDEALRGNPDLSERLLESHPELCFQTLNLGHPLRYPKKTEEGIKERIAILERYSPFFQHVFSNERKKAQRIINDILDAVCLALCAFLSTKYGISRIPEFEERDNIGLRMQVHYPCLPKT